MKKLLKRNKPQRSAKVRPDKNHSAGLTNCLNENPRTRKDLNEISLFFLEDSLICQDYELNYIIRQF